jgi:hypothetical protein
MRLIYHPEAEAELVEAAEFYEARSPGLDERFLREFDAAIAEVQASPSRWSVVFRRDYCLNSKDLRREPRRA